MLTKATPGVMLVGADIRLFRFVSETFSTKIGSTHKAASS